MTGRPVCGHVGAPGDISDLLFAIVDNVRLLPSSIRPSFQRGYDFRPLRAMPSMKKRCRTKKISTIGIMQNVEAAMRR